MASSGTTTGLPSSRSRCAATSRPMPASPLLRRGYWGRSAKTARATRTTATARASIPTLNQEVEPMAYTIAQTLNNVTVKQCSVIATADADAASAAQTWVALGGTAFAAAPLYAIVTAITAAGGLSS